MKMSQKEALRSSVVFAAIMIILIVLITVVSQLLGYGGYDNFLNRLPRTLIFVSSAAFFSYIYSLRQIRKRDHEIQKVMDKDTKFKLLFENAENAILVIDKERIIDCNPKALEIFECERNEIIGQTPMALSPLHQPDGGDSRMLAYQWIEEALKGIAQDFEWVHQKPNGQLFDAEITLSSVPIDNSTYLIGIVRDISKRKEQENKLKESETTYREIFDSVSEAIYVHDYHTGELVDVNEAVCDMYGYTSEEFKGMSVEDFSAGEPPYSQVEADELLKRVKDEGELTFIWRDKRKGGVNFWTDNHMKLAHINGKLRILVISRDITEKINREEEIKKKEKKYGELFQQAGDGILVGDFSGEITDANHAMSVLSRYSKDELIGMNINSLFHKEVLDEVPLRYDLVKEGKSVIVERELKTKDGESVPVEMNTKLASDGKIQCFMRDLSKRKTAEKNLQISEKKYRDIVQHANSAIIKYDVEGNLTFFNEYAEQLFGFKEEEVIGKNLTDTILPKPFKDESHMYSKEWLKDVIQNIDENESLEDYNQRKDGSMLYISWTNKPLFDDDGNLIGIVSVGSDVTERKMIYDQLKNNEELLKLQNQEYHKLNDELRLSNKQIKKINEELRLAKEKAEQSDRLKSAFLSNMSHEIRTPMNGIIGFAEMLKDNRLTDNEREYFTDIIVESSNRLLNTVNDILDISKIETGQLEYIESKVKLNEIIRNIHSFYNKNAEAKGLDYLIELGLSDEESLIYTDELKLRQVFSNLVSNAFKFTEEGEIKLSYFVDKDMLHFTVADTGIGIAENMQETIFDRFNQVSSSGEKLYGGTGLGLSICKGNIDLMEGKIWLVSKQGKGSAFHFKIPYKSVNGDNEKESTRETDSTIINTETPDWSGFKVLLVEDEDSNVLFLKQILRNTGIDFTIAKDGIVAVDEFVSNSFDLVLLDIKLPGKSGLEVLQEIKAHNKDVPVIAQTAFALNQEKNQMLSAGCDDYIAKPIMRTELLKKLNRYLKS